MKYKNIVFDFGNVLATFNEHQILSAFCEEKDMEVFKEAVFYNWQTLDEGSVPYNEYANHALSLLPERLHDNVTDFFQNWYQKLTPIQDIWNLIYNLKEQGYKLYILSNAPTYFAEHAAFFEIIKEFDGTVFSAPINMWKPNHNIYQHLFEKYQLNPSECFFIDDRANNIAAAKACGMDGIVFDENIDAVKRAIKN